MIPKKIVSSIRLLVSLLAGVFLGAGFRARTKGMTPEQGIRRSLDYVEINKAMAMHTCAE